MAFRFWRRLKIARGLHVNLSRSGASLSLGPEGATGTLGPGGARASFGMPGTGLFYTIQPKKRRSSASTKQTHDARPPRPDLGFLGRMTASTARRWLAKGIEAWQDGNEVLAQRAFEQATREDDDEAAIMDAAWFAGLLGLANEDVEVADHHFARVQRDVTKLGVASEALGVTPVFVLEVTDQAAIALPPHPFSFQLAMAEVRQQQGEHKQARALLEPLLGQDGLDPLVVLTAWCDVVLEGPHDDEELRQVVERTAELRNDSVLHAILLLYKGRALFELGLLHAARDTLTLAYRKRADRPEELRRSIRFVRAAVYEALGQTTRARSEREAIYAEDPNFPELAEILGVSTAH